ncbi:alpha/beta hydrolase [Lutibaculum baratangense AMV1]|uniref:Alpha/beta hydrolase n=1 Tax=Lutibaculum baratangense AMV1 TaxID=631454 RepID=V4RHN7_9HYPH|nr:alpha/beta hydrolase [Lutibaculum baratangense AMV1]
MEAETGVEDAASAAIERIDGACEHAWTPDGEHRIRWRLIGEGRPLVLLHGGYGSWMHWLKAMEALAGHRRVACPDMPGFAQSGGRKPPYDPPRIAVAVAEGLGHLFGTATPLGVAGFSFGGTVAGHLARALAGRARSLALIGSGGLGSARPEIVMRSRARGMSAREILEVHRHNLAALMFKDPARIDALALEIQRRNTETRPTIVTRRYSRTPVLAEILREVPCPVHAIWGDGDATVGPFIESRLSVLRQGAPDARATIVPDCGHWAMYEQPEAVVTALMS